MKQIESGRKVRRKVNEIECRIEKTVRKKYEKNKVKEIEGERQKIRERQKMRLRKRKAENGRERRRKTENERV